MAATIHYLKSPQHPAVRSAYVRAMPRPAQAVYRRRRVGVLAIAVAIAAAGAFGLNGTKASADQALPGQQTEPHFVVAQSGDTLWAIAQRIAPQANTAELVDELVRMNGDSISVGQRVLVP
ncbi:MAG: LysM peptidoglycan-binding domain-containing protein [Actinobacteria bacterium]|nr:LysM peptidoglycan-binding domain-containing protein [Actinomycetota bacterium]